MAYVHEILLKQLRKPQRNSEAVGGIKAWTARFKAQAKG